MAITTRAKTTLKNELDRLKKERAVIDKDIKALETSLKALGSDVARTVTRRPRKATGKKPGRPKGKATGAKRGRKSKRQTQVLNQVKKNPGISVGEIAKKIPDIKNATALYPAVKRLEEDGKIKKKGKQLFVA